jgi:hypothetical protein
MDFPLFNAKRAKNAKFIKKLGVLGGLRGSNWHLTPRIIAQLE